MGKKRRLGRGLDSLLSKTIESIDSIDTSEDTVVHGTGEAGEVAVRGETELPKSSEANRGTEKAASVGEVESGEGTRMDSASIVSQRKGHIAVAEKSGSRGSDTNVAQGGVTDRKNIAVESRGRNSAAVGIEARMVNVRLLSPNPRQPRSAITEGSVAGLAESIKQTGILQPITVRARGGGYEVVTGERRWRAAELAGLREVPVVVREVSDEEMLELALVENIQREDLNAIDRAVAYEQYCRRFGKKPEEAGRRLGEDRSTVVNFLRLLELPEEVKGLVAKGLLSAGHGRSLLGLGDPVKMGLMAREIVKHGLSVRAVEEIVRRSKVDGGRGRGVSGARPAKSAHMKDLESRLTVACGTKVVVEEGRQKGRGKIVIEYYSLDDFDQIARRLGLEE